MVNIALESAETKDFAKANGNYVKYVVRKHGKVLKILRGQKAVNFSAINPVPLCGEINYSLAKNIQTGKVENTLIAESWNKVI